MSDKPRTRRTQFNTAPVKDDPRTCRECSGRGWSLATWTRAGGKYLLFCQCQTGQDLREAVAVRERRRGVSDKPRTWTLKGWDGESEDMVDVLWDGPGIAREQLVPVIELEPVLDLLEALKENERDGAAFGIEQREALLCEHGRLGG